MRRLRNTTDTQPRLECPRCAYDLSGVAQSWRDFCPLSGVCSECGYSVEWANVFDPTRERLPWLYEHARSWWAPAAMLKTAFLSLLPWVFWRRLQPKHYVRLSRAIALPIILTLTIHALGAITLLGLDLARDAMPGTTPMLNSTALWSQAGAYLTVRGPAEAMMQALGGAFAPKLLASFLGLVIVGAPLGYLIAALAARTARRKGALRPTHLLRCTAYSLGIAPLAHALLWSVVVWLAVAYTLAEWRVRTHGIAAGASVPLTAPPYTLMVEVIEAQFMLLPAILWPAIFWGFALVRSLRMRGGWQVWIAGFILSPLVVGVVVVIATGT